MRELSVRNVHEALPQAVRLLQQEGFRRESRNGPVMQAPWPVVTTYAKPCERVLFHPERDANPFFHLYESLWMLAGRNDLASVAHFAKNMENYSDDGHTLHGAYGHRWRWDPQSNHIIPFDQLGVIRKRLRDDPDDRRSVLQMWQGGWDLGRMSKDIPCNLIATFQRDAEGKLDLTVFCRSNDIVWGAYGANAVHFSFLLEYMANWIGCDVGVYRQISVNWHAYLETLRQVAELVPDRVGYIYNPYATGAKHLVHVVPLPADIEKLDEQIAKLLLNVEQGFSKFSETVVDEPFFDMAYTMFRAHQAWKYTDGQVKFGKALDILSAQDPTIDWVAAGREWILRRELAWARKNP